MTAIAALWCKWFHRKHYTPIARNVQSVVNCSRCGCWRRRGKGWT